MVVKARAWKLLSDGLWVNNPGLVQLLGLCPLLAVTGSVVNGLGMGLATTVTLVCSGFLAAVLRPVIREEIRIPIFVLIIATTVTAIELSLKAWFFPLYQNLGIFIPLIVTNCVIIGRAEGFASKNRPSWAIFDGLMMGLGFTWVLMVLGGMRELIGSGTLFMQADLLWSVAADWSLRLPNYSGFLPILLPPGAFFCLGMLVALKNWIDQRQQISREALAAAT